MLVACTGGGTPSHANPEGHPLSNGGRVPKNNRNAHLASSQSPTPTQAASKIVSPKNVTPGGSSFRNVRHTNPTFYPRVLDDYKDNTILDWNRRLEVEGVHGVGVRRSGYLLIGENTIIYSTHFDYGCGGFVSWDGHLQGSCKVCENSGRPVCNGTYKITVRYFNKGYFNQYGETQALGPVTHAFSRNVTVATGTKWFPERYSVRGASFDTRKTRGRCHIYRISGQGDLDCWGGRYAKVGYSFYVAYDLAIKNFRWWVRGTVGCCKPGTLTRTGPRRRHNLSIRVRVTNWRRYTVNGVGFSWMAKNRI